MMEQPNKPIVLTKYPFQKGTQCEKSIWLNYYRPDLKSPVSPEQQMLMDKGKDVGLLAREIYGGGIDVSNNETIRGPALIEATRLALQSENQVFYEAAFETLNKRMMFKADILVRCERSTKLLEVKSSTSIKLPQHILDLAFQYYVLKNSDYSGPPIEVYLVYLNKHYKRGEELSIDELFVSENITRRVQDAQPLITRYLQQFESTLAGSSTPSIKVSEACFQPYECPFFKHCWESVPPISVFNIGKLWKTKASEFYREGIIEPHHIPRDAKLSEAQWIEVNAAIEGKPSINRLKLSEFIESLNLDGPTLWMDFESMMPACPPFPNLRPYQQLCFQYCVLYRRGRQGKIHKMEFLAEPGKDPRRQFIERLLEDTAMKGNIVVYNKQFEVKRLEELAKAFPEYDAAIEERISRIVDLMIPFEKKYYYHPQMKGKYSIKVVLPILVPPTDLSYENLSIANGSMAMSMYERFEKLSPKEQIETRRALLDYCHLDCLGMIYIADKLDELL